MCSRFALLQLIAVAIRRLWAAGFTSAWRLLVESARHFPEPVCLMPSRECLKSALRASLIPQIEIVRAPKGSKKIARALGSRATQLRAAGLVLAHHRRTTMQGLCHTTTISCATAAPATPVMVVP